MAGADSSELRQLKALEDDLKAELKELSSKLDGLAKQRLDALKAKEPDIAQALKEDISRGEKDISRVEKDRERVQKKVDSLEADVRAARSQGSAAAAGGAAAGGADAKGAAGNGASVAGDYKSAPTGVTHSLSGSAVPSVTMVVRCLPWDLADDEVLLAPQTFAAFYEAAKRVVHAPEDVKSRVKLYYYGLRDQRRKIDGDVSYAQFLSLVQLFGNKNVKCFVVGGRSDGGEPDSPDNKAIPYALTVDTSVATLATGAVKSPASGDSGKTPKSANRDAAARDAVLDRDADAKVPGNVVCCFCGNSYARSVPGGESAIVHAHIVPLNDDMMGLPKPKTLEVGSPVYALNMVQNLWSLCDRCHKQQGNGALWVDTSPDGDPQKWTVAVAQDATLNLPPEVKALHGQKYRLPSDWETKRWLLPGHDLLVFAKAWAERRRSTKDHGAGKCFQCQKKATAKTARCNNKLCAKTAQAAGAHTRKEAVYYVSRVLQEGRRLLLSQRSQCVGGRCGWCRCGCSFGSCRRCSRRRPQRCEEGLVNDGAYPLTPAPPHDTPALGSPPVVVGSCGVSCRRHAKAFGPQLLSANAFKECACAQASTVAQAQSAPLTLHEQPYYALAPAPPAPVIVPSPHVRAAPTFVAAPPTPAALPGGPLSLL